MELMRKMKRRDRLIKLNGRRQDYKTLRNEIVSECRKAERQYVKRKIEECWNDAKGHWDILKRIMGKTNNKMDFPSLFRHNGETLTGKKQIADSLNEYHSKVGPETNRSVGNSKKHASYYLQKK